MSTAAVLLMWISAALTDRLPPPVSLPAEVAEVGCQSGD